MLWQISFTAYELETCSKQVPRAKDERTLKRESKVLEIAELEATGIRCV